MMAAAIFPRRPHRPARAWLVATAALVAAPAMLAAQSAQDDDGLGRADARQIGEASSPASRAFLNEFEPQAADGARRPELEQVSRTNDSAGRELPDPQIPASGDGGLSVMQLSKVELDSTLSQLSAAERRVLFDAIEGTDICDNPPDVPAIIALCRTRIEMLPSLYEATPQRALTAEETLLNGSADAALSPSLEQVVDRLSRTRAASDDFSNQAIASVALSRPPAIGSSTGEEGGEADTLAPGTQDLINAIINQLSGSGSR